MVSAKVALNSLAEAVPLNSDVDSLLSVYSRNQLANETLQADCWGQEDCLALVTLTLHIGGESKVQSDIELCLSFTQSNGGDIQLTSRSRDFRFHVQRLRVLLEHHYLPGQGAALTERWRVLARVLSSLQATYLEPNGGADPWATYSRAGIRMISPGIGDSTSRTEHSNASTGDGEVGYCVALLVKELAVLVADLAADPYRQGDLQIVAAAVKQTVSVYRSLADWFLARTQAPCSTNHGALPAAQAALARDAIAAFLQSLGSEVAVHEATL